MSSNIKYGYLVDPKNPKRVITVARRVVGEDTVEFNYAVCWPGFRTVVSDKDYCHSKVAYLNGDLFKKEIGRKIAAGRLEKHPFVQTLKKDEHPMDAIRRAVKENIVQLPPSARRAFIPEN